MHNSLLEFVWQFIFAMNAGVDLARPTGKFAGCSRGSVENLEMLLHL